jgi:hypothetical protein
MRQSKEEIKVQRKAHYEANKTRITEKNKEYVEANKDKVKAYHQAYYQDNKEMFLEGSRKHRLKRAYGLTPEQFEQMKQAQEDKCALCPATEPGGKGEWHIDHCHETGRVRKLLCSSCNIHLGFLEKFNRDTEWVAKAQNYLHQHNGD